VDHRLGRPRATERTGREHLRRQLSHHEDLASHSVDGGAEDGEGSGDDQRDVHAEVSYMRACTCILDKPVDGAGAGSSPAFNPG